MPYLSDAYVRESAETVRELLDAAPKVGLVLGSGLGQIAAAIDDARTLAFADVPHMQVSTARGHSSQFVAGELGGKQVIAMQGRLHAYEGYDAADTVYPIRLMAELGVRTLVLTNATGGINTSYHAGDVVLVTDHINLTGRNPLVGVRDEQGGGVVTPDMTFAYTPRLRELMLQVAADEGVELREGVYLGVGGPSFETPAEIRAFRVLGADLVGMSSVFESIEAAHLGVDMCMLSLVTNMAAGVLNEPLDGSEIVRIAEKSAAVVGELLTAFLKRL